MDWRFELRHGAESRAGLQNWRYEGMVRWEILLLLLLRFFYDMWVYYSYTPGCCTRYAHFAGLGIVLNEKCFWMVAVIGELNKVYRDMLNPVVFLWFLFS
jgi:hypothetical protein